VAGAIASERLVCVHFLNGPWVGLRPMKGRDRSSVVQFPESAGIIGGTAVHSMVLSVSQRCYSQF
jgi:hypothetical protein